MPDARAPEPRTSRVEAGALGLAVHDWGGDGPPVVLAHATGFHGRIWAPIAARLVAAGRRVWSFDFRGHGASDAPPPAADAADERVYAWDRFADDVLAVLDHTGVAGDPALVTAGHSKGAAALLLAEARRPGVAGHIWAFEPIVFPTEVTLAPADDFPMAVAARRRRDVWDSAEQAAAAWASKPPLDVMTPETMAAYARHALHERADGTLALACRPEVEARVYAMGPNHGLWARLETVGAPVVVACGEHSDSIGPPLAARIVDRLPDARLEVWESAGHFGPQQDPDRAARSMRGAGRAPG